MKSSSSARLIALVTIALPIFSPLVAQETPASRKPIVISSPAVQNGSSASRAPFIANRPFDDLKRPDGQAIDKNVPPNTPASDREPDPLPEPRVAILQRTPAPFATDPGLLPTGRTTVSVATSVDVATVTPTIRGGSFEAREQVAADIENRIKNADTALAAIRNSRAQMSATGREQFNSAEESVKNSEKALRKSLRAARKASATEWESSRTQLAADYEAYASALARVDTATGVTPMPAR